MAEHFVYIIECRDGTLYTGYAKDVSKRIKAHNEGKGAKYTRNRRPVHLLHKEAHETKSEALKREYAIKKLSRHEKLKLVRRE